MRPSMSVLGQLRGMGPGIKSGAGSAIVSPPTFAFLGVSAIKGLGRVARDGTVITNPWFFRSAHSGYGKRGIDANNLGADGLTLGLHNKRRKR